MLSKTPFSPRVCPKQENLLRVVSFVNGASSAEACHGTAHNMYYIFYQHLWDFDMWHPRQ